MQFVARPRGAPGPVPLLSARLLAGERLVVGDRLERLAQRALDDASPLGHRVGDLQFDLDVGEAGGVEPVPLVQRAGVQHLQHELDVCRVEEGEVAGVFGQMDAGRQGGVLAGGGGEAGPDPEAAVVEAEGRRVRDAFLDRLGRSVRLLLDGDHHATLAK